MKQKIFMQEGEGLAELVAQSDFGAVGEIKACQERVAKLEHNGCYEAAASACLEMLKVAPSCLPVYRHVALELAVFGKAEDALETCRKAIELAPFAPASYMLIGEIYFEMRQYRSAIDAYLRAVELGTEDVEPFLYLGHSYFAIHRYEQAAEAYTEAISLEPKNAEAHLSVGMVYNELKRYEKAIAFLTRYMELSEDDGVAQAALGRALFGSGCYREAAAAYEKALTQRPCCPDCHRGLIQAYEAAGQQVEAAGVKDVYQQMLVKAEEEELSIWRKLIE